MMKYVGLTNLKDPMTPLGVLCSLQGTSVGSLGNTVIKYLLRSVSPEAEPETKVGVRVND